MTKNNNNKNLLRKRKQSGYGLVELMVAASIGIVLTAGTMQYFSMTKKNHVRQQANDEMIENGRFAVSVIRNASMNAGHLGCATRSDDTKFNTILNDPTGFAWNFTQGLHGNEYDGSTWDPAIDTSLTAPAPTQSDIITLRAAIGESYQVQDHAFLLRSVNLPVSLNGDDYFEPFDLVMVSDCEFTDIFQATTVVDYNIFGLTGTSLRYDAVTVPTGPGNTNQNLGKRYTSMASVTKLQNTSFYTALNDQNIPALYKVENGDVATEIISGIEDIQIRYGVDNNTDLTVDQYLTADTVEAQAAWDEVLAIELRLLLRSAKDRMTVNNAPQTYTYNGTTVTASDTFLRSEMNATINLRNRMP